MEASSKKAKSSYGPNAIDSVPDVSDEALQVATTTFLKKHVDLTEEQIDASNVSPSLNRSRLYGKRKGEKGNKHTRKGLRDERITLREYELKKAELGIDVSITPAGLIIDKTHKYLGGSPDGIIKEKSGETGLVECQGLLGITNLPWIDFVVRTTNPYQLHIERIVADKQLWNEIMVPKHCAFYHKAILPELSSPREGKVPGIWETGIWFEPASKQLHHQSASVSVQPRKRRSTSTVTSSFPPVSCSASVSHSLTTTNTSATLSASSTPATVSVTGRSFSLNLTRTQATVSTTDTLATVSTTDTPATVFTTDTPATVSTTDTPATVSMTNTPATVSTSDRPATVSTTNTTSRRHSRRRVTKFLGRRISHEWTIDERTGERKWYNGSVLAVLQGIDGGVDTVYEILYDSEDDPHEVNGLLDDYQDSTVRFIDL
ncbi:uncharacterized protein [Argopecten irradians]|uniref:uncharacterized protein n=1 Tax=Argopecten irradians TaxID=31199 RepID=UPI003710FE36